MSRRATRLHHKARIARDKAARKREAFLQHLKAASDIVAGWPEWKRNLLGRTTGCRINHFP